MNQFESKTCGIPQGHRGALHSEVNDTGHMRVYRIDERATISAIACVCGGYTSKEAGRRDDHNGYVLGPTSLRLPRRAMAQVREKSLSPQPIRRVDAPSAQPNAPQAAGSTCLPRLTLCTLCGRCKSIGIPKRKFPLPRMVPALYPQGIRDVNGYFSPQATHHRADHAGAIPQSECVRVTCNELVGR